MGLSANAEAVLALNRFGLGPRLGSVRAVAADPRGALIAEIDRAGAGLLPSGTLTPSAQAFRIVADANATRQARRILAARAQQAAQKAADRRVEGEAEGTAMTGPDSTAMAAARTESEAAEKAAAGVADPGRQIYLDEAKARTDAALAAETGFAERLVWFFSNHFCISANKIQSMAGAYEREAIRPHALGAFAAMLQAVESHPAMLFYLDNAASMGPNSVAGINRTRGLNENLAREILELHTLGVRTVYTQEDVVSFAKVLTGWTFIPPDNDPDHGGEFTFNRRLHEPGAHKVIAKVYADEGVEQGRAVLRDLAAHPQTAAHITTKLARHFVADSPPQSLCDRLAATFRDTAGDLKEVAKTLIRSEEAWSVPIAKLRRPSQWMLAMLRAAGAPADPARFTAGQALLGEPLWRPPSPKGYADDEATWIDGIGQRLDIANTVAERVADRVDAREIVEQVLASTASAATREAVTRAESRQQALTLLFMSSELQRG
jgi:uncharacterized protein (DUF1800 family)